MISNLILLIVGEITFWVKLLLTLFIHILGALLSKRMTNYSFYCGIMDMNADDIDLFIYLY
jgi:hypothetical protein